MVRPLVSVAMATYNGEKYLREQIDSIITQTYSPIQIIVTDDCSSDGTIEILEEYQNSHKLKFFQNEITLGYVKNFEKAIKLCSGEYIALADQDDIWEPNKIDLLVQEIGTYSLIHSDALLIDSEGGLIEESYSRFSKKMTNPKNFTQILLNGSVTGCTSLCKKTFLDSLLPFPEGLYVHDKWMGIFAYLNQGLVYTDKPLISYRQHTSNSIGAQNPSITFIERVKRAIRSRGTINRGDLRISIEKEKRLIELVILHGRLTKENLEQAKKIGNFYKKVLMGKQLSSVATFFLKNIKSFEMGKPIAQKLYFFSLMLLIFFDNGHVSNKNN